LAMVEMIDAGKAGKVGIWTLALYSLTTFLAALEAIVVTLLFKPLFNVEDPVPPSTKETFVHVECEDGMYLATGSDGIVSCVSVNGFNDTLPSNFSFTIDDVNNVFVKTADGTDTTADISISNQIIDGIFMKLVSANITDEFANDRFLGVIFFAMVVGIAATRSKTKPKTFMAFLREVNDILVVAITWVVALTPIAVFSMVVEAIGKESDIVEIFQNVGVLMGATLTTMAIHVLIVYPSLFYGLTKSNPLTYLRHIVPAQVLAFATSSSVGTLPLTLECVRNSGMVSDAVRNFVLPVGSTINMDGTALYFPVATIWLATTQGLEIGAVDYILIVILSTLGSAGTAPVPSASLVFIVTTFNTVFGTTGTPEYFYIMMAIDWLLDRFRTLVNVTGDTLVARMVEVRAGGDCGNIQNKDSDSDTPADDETSLRENSLDMQYV